jgi:phenylpropionate dioxygenase-like ring-hydroxylating dioxygenase large terminal subunit
MRQQVLCDTFFKSLDSSVRDVNEAEMLPPPCYVSEEFYEFEKGALFDREWLCVGREAWATKPGDYFTIEHVNEPIVVLRDNAGALRAFSNVCRHRAMLLAEGHGNARNLLCQYHHWCYSLDGKLIGAPAMDKAVGFDKTTVCLPEFKIEIWQGFVFVNFDQDAPPLAPRVATLTAALDNFELSVLVGVFPAPPVRLPWNWMVMMENNHDGYHANKLHAGPLHNIVPSHLSVFPELPEDTGCYFRWNGTEHQDAAFNPTRRALMPVFPKLTEKERNNFIFAQVPPTLSLIVMSDQITYMILSALSANEVAMTRGWLVAKGAMKSTLFQEKLRIGQESIKSIVAQDLHVDEMIPHGLKSRFAPRGRYSWQEQAQREFNCWLVRRYQKAWNASRLAAD